LYAADGRVLAQEAKGVRPVQARVVRLDGHRQELDDLPSDLGVPYWDATAAVSAPLAELG